MTNEEPRVVRGEIASFEKFWNKKGIWAAAEEFDVTETSLLADRLERVKEEAVAADGALVSCMRAICEREIDAEVEKIMLGQMSPGFASLLKTMMGKDVDRLLRERNQRKRIDRQLQAAERLRTALRMVAPSQLKVALAELTR